MDSCGQGWVYGEPDDGDDTSSGVVRFGPFAAIYAYTRIWAPIHAYANIYTIYMHIRAYAGMPAHRRICTHTRIYTHIRASAGIYGHTRAYAGIHA